MISIHFFFNINLQKIRIKSFECPKSIRNYKEKYLEHQTLGRRVVCPIGPAYYMYIVDCRFYGLPQTNRMSVKEDLGGFCAESAGCADIST